MEGEGEGKGGTRLYGTYHNGSLLAVFLVEVDHALEGVVADDVTVENKEWL